MASWGRCDQSNDSPREDVHQGDSSISDQCFGHAIRVIAGATEAQAQLDLANLFVQRSEFLAKYPASLTGPEFVDALLARIISDSGIDLYSLRTSDSDVATSTCSLCQS